MVRRRRRKRHPNKHIEEALQDAERHGFQVLKSAGHPWGVLRCPGDCPQKSVWSTPRHPQSHARDISRTVERCPHTEGHR